MTRLSDTVPLGPLRENPIHSADSAGAEKAVNQAVDDFITNISHDIRTPLSAIMGYAEMMYDSQQTVRNKLACLGKIRKKVVEITELLDDSIEFSRLDAGVIGVHSKEISLLDNLCDTLLSLRSEAQKKRLGFAVRSEGELPSHIVSDPLLLRELIFNVVGGAINLTERGSIEIVIKLIPSAVDNHSQLLALIVNCRGSAGESKEKELIANSQTSINSFPRRSANTGQSLWLNISQRLARILGGDLLPTTNQEGVSRRFLMTISPGPPSNQPGLQAVTLNDLETRAALRNSSARTTMRGMHILLVEDDVDLQQITNHVVTTVGASLNLAADGIEALEKVASGSYDLVLMDIEMPRLNGYETTLHLRKSGFKSPIVALTAHATTQNKDRCIKAGCNDYVLKPLSADKLLQIISQYL